MEEYLEEFKNKKNRNKSDSNKNYFSKLITKILLSVIFVLVSLIYTNNIDNNLLLYKEYVLTESMSFTSFKSWYENLFGSVVVNNEVTQVFKDNLAYTSISDYYDGEELTLTSNIVNTIESGIVVYIGEKEDLGSTIIIQGIDGYDIWYGNMENISVSLYDYIETDTLIGNVIDNTLYLIIKNNNEYIKYEEYKNK